MNTEEFRAEVYALRSRWGAKPHVIARWLESRGLTGACDFMTHWPGTWRQSNEAAYQDFVHYVMNR